MGATYLPVQGLGERANIKLTRNVNYMPPSHSLLKVEQMSCMVKIKFVVNKTASAMTPEKWYSVAFHVARSLLQSSLLSTGLPPIDEVATRR